MLDKVLKLIISFISQLIISKFIFFLIRSQLKKNLVFYQKSKIVQDSFGIAFGWIFLW